MSIQDDLHPSGVHLTHLSDAYEAHNAACLVKRKSAMASLHHIEDSQTRLQRVMLESASKLLIQERDRLLDEFCKEWLRYRGKPQQG